MLDVRCCDLFSSGLCLVCVSPAREGPGCSSDYLLYWHNPPVHRATTSYQRRRRSISPHTAASPPHTDWSLRYNSVLIVSHINHTRTNERKCLALKNHEPFEEIIASIDKTWAINSLHSSSKTTCVLLYSEFLLAKDNGQVLHHKKPHDWDVKLKHDGHMHC